MHELDGRRATISPIHGGWCHNSLHLEQAFMLTSADLVAHDDVTLQCEYKTQLRAVAFMHSTLMSLLVLHRLKHSA